MSCVLTVRFFAIYVTQECLSGTFRKISQSCNLYKWKNSTLMGILTEYLVTRYKRGRRFSNEPRVPENYNKIRSESLSSVRFDRVVIQS